MIKPVSEITTRIADTIREYKHNLHNRQGSTWEYRDDIVDQIYGNLNNVKSYSDLGKCLFGNGAWWTLYIGSLADVIPAIQDYDLWSCSYSNNAYVLEHLLWAIDKEDIPDIEKHIDSNDHANNELRNFYKAIDREIVRRRLDGDDELVDVLSI